MEQSLAEMACFEQDVIIYGFAWRDRNGRTMYTTSENEVLACQAFDEKALLKYDMSPIYERTTRAILKEETQEQTIFELKLCHSNILRETYSDAYFETIHALAALEADRQAEDILRQWQEEIDGYYDEDAVRLFEGALNLAYIGRHVHQETYLALCTWIQQYRKQIVGKLEMKDNFQRTFYGIAFEKPDQSLGFACNANEKAIFDRAKALDAQGTLHTPIFSKDYWYHRSNELKDVRAAFEKNLRELMDANYFERLKKLQHLSNSAHRDTCQAIVDRAQEKLSEKEMEGVRYWVNRWQYLS
ncbi:MAG: hypothetical protein Q4C56_07615 [Peptococcaceae bacterium]|nr:hypothetical protein [Peptococcaceae bacterium]